MGSQNDSRLLNIRKCTENVNSNDESFVFLGSLQRSRTRRGQEMASTDTRDPYGRERKRGEI